MPRHGVKERAATMQSETAQKIYREMRTCMDTQSDNLIEGPKQDD